jgi:hypothetical protein
LGHGRPEDEEGDEIEESGPDKTWVETMVAMELAASCMPLVKSKAKATKMMKATKITLAAGISLSWT